MRGSGRLSACAALAWLWGTPVGLAQEPGEAEAPRNEAATRTGGSLGARADLPSIPRTDGEFEIDGVIDEDAWQRALVIELTTETNPGENVPAPVRTSAYFIEDGTTLYVAFDARDPEPDLIRAYLRDRDAAYDDDFVGVVLDTFGDERRGFEFFVNPLGVQMDLKMDDVGGGEDDSWDAIWDSAGTITDTGYVTEMAIPFSQLRFPNTTDVKTWGIDALRFYPRNNRIRMSNNAQDRGRNCYLCQLEKVEGFANVEPTTDIEVVPSLTASRTDRREDFTGPLIPGDSDGELGVTVKWGVTQDMTANLALNPDFSQIEADVPQLDVNNQFALFFPETRPFFLEGADYFNSPLQAVFTRTVADPDFGAKLTGQRGDDTYGVFVARDAVTNLLFPGTLSSRADSLDIENDALVGRYSWGFGQSSTVGALLTSRRADDYVNNVAGLDSRYRLSDRHSFEFQYLRSETEYPDATAVEFDQPLGRFDDDAFTARYHYSSRNWFANADYERFDPNFRVDSGFITQVDYSQYHLNAGHIWHGDDETWWNRMQLGSNFFTTRDRSGRKIAQNVNSFFTLQGPFQSFMNFGVNKRQQFWNGVLYDTRNRFLNGQVRPRGGLTFGLSANYGGQIDFANSRLARQTRVEPRVEWNAGRHLLVRLNHTISVLDSREGPNIFEAKLSDFRLTWQFNVRSFLRLTVQRQVIERNLALFASPTVDARSGSRGAQLLYSYKVNPQTVLFAGYSNNHLHNDDLETLTEVDRTLFLKLSYAWLP